MADTVYLPHHLGTVVGSHVLRPWLADDAQQAIDTPWRGQPTFTSAADAYAWLYWARTQPWLPDGLSIARTDAQPTIDDTRTPRLHVDQDQLRHPEHQVLRTKPAGAGPDEQALAAGYGMARAAAARTWLIDQAGADANTRIDAAVRHVWEYGARLASADARAALAGQVQRSVRAVQAVMSASTLGRPRGPAWTYLQRLDQAAATIIDNPTTALWPDLDPALLAEFRAQMRAGGELGAWDNALADVWKRTLRTAVLAAISTAGQDITDAARTDDLLAPPHARIEGQSALDWLKITLNDANRAVAIGWLFATARLAEAPEPRPDAADPPLSPDADLATDNTVHIAGTSQDDTADVDDHGDRVRDGEVLGSAVPAPGPPRIGRAFPAVPGIGEGASPPPVTVPATGPGEAPGVAGPSGRPR